MGDGSGGSASDNFPNRFVVEALFGDPLPCEELYCGTVDIVECMGPFGRMEL